MARENRYRGRFAPSPTGPLHFGSLIAAAASYLDARSRAGEWLVRMEDLDAPRAAPGAASTILRQLEDFGFEWDGEVVFQSTRTALYRAALERLRESGLVYPCSCLRKEIADSSTPGRASRTRRYPGICRNGPANPFRPLAWRIRAAAAPVAFSDLIQGDQKQRLDRECGDFVLLRADGVFAYQLAVAVDDAAQDITHVIRGADLLDSTFRQILVQDALGLPRPRYGHFPVAANPSGEKLSKQTRAAPVRPDDPAPHVWNALDFLGQAPPRELIRARRDLWKWAILHWDLTRVPRKRVITQTGAQTG